MTSPLTDDGSFSVVNGKLPGMDLLGAITSETGRIHALTKEGAGLNVTGAGTLGLDKALIEN